MNNIRNIYGLALVLSLSLLVLASCSDDDAQPVVKSSAKSITSVSFLGLNPKIAGFVGENSKVVSVIVPAGTDVTALVPTIVISDKAAILPASGAKQDFSSPVTYTVTAEDGTEQQYKVSVSKEGMAITSLSAEQIDRGQTLTIYGDGFSTSENTVKIVGEGDRGFSTLEITSESATKIDVVVSEWLWVGKFYIVVENEDGLSFMYPETLTVGHPVAVASVDKTSAHSGENIVFAGENFNHEDNENIQVEFSGNGGAYWVDYHPSASEDGTRLTATVPEGIDAGAYTVIVVVGFEAVYSTDFHVIGEQ